MYNLAKVCESSICTILHMSYKWTDWHIIDAAEFFCEIATAAEDIEQLSDWDCEIGFFCIDLYNAHKCRHQG